MNDDNLPSVSVEELARVIGGMNAPIELPKDWSGMAGMDGKSLFGDFGGSRGFEGFGVDGFGGISL